jgi:hypothetical protein
LRNYLDKAKENVKGRNREYSNQFANETAPFNCPEWTVDGYNGELKRVVNNACDK